ncbi:MAG: Holliday junction resolvase RuvX [Helicobacter sp.]|nr:Holliday junction resolvase RuvX [Helicobacter sp.]MCI7485083.1 Holliday junction resolvase RuvX [Helicobacter sp.]MDD7567712.1 Holliday junction resolvase RuvX [Helicobacter sp.]MDY5740129.1 Holliday junction resolvase RuvX [Helicobacter sp.]
MLDSQIRVVACDVGLKRIGVAILEQNIILPLEPILRINRNQAAEQLSTLLKNKAATHLIVGKPSGGEAGHMDTQRRIEHFVGLLDFDGQIIFVNEDYSSKEVMGLLPSKKLRRERKGKLDSISAMIILRTFMEGGSA